MTSAEPRPLLALAALVVSLLALAACGSSGDAADSPTSTLSRAQFLRQGNALCQAGTNEITSALTKWEKGHRSGGKPATEAARDKALSQIALKVRKEELRELRELGLPLEGQYTVELILDAWEEGVENGERNLLSMQASNEDFAFAKAFQISSNFGLSGCW